MIHVDHISEVQGVKNAIHAFVNPSGGYDVYVVGDDVPIVDSAISFAPVTPRQIRQALTQAGLRSQVEATVKSGSQDVKDWWEFANTFERTHPIINSMASGLNISSSQLDQLWQLAATL